MRFVALKALNYRINLHSAGLDLFLTHSMLEVQFRLHVAAAGRTHKLGRQHLKGDVGAYRLQTSHEGKKHSIQGLAVQLTLHTFLPKCEKICRPQD